jgi:hypothetical protein
MKNKYIVHNGKLQAFRSDRNRLHLCLGCIESTHSKNGRIWQNVTQGDRNFRNKTEVLRLVHCDNLVSESTQQVKTDSVRYQLYNTIDVFTFLRTRYSDV